MASDLEATPSLGPNLLNSDTFREINERQFTRRTVDVEHGKLGDDGTDGACASKRESTLLEDLGAAAFGGVFHNGDNFSLVGIRDEVHGTTDT